MVRFGILKQEERKQNRHLLQNDQDDYFVFSYEHVGDDIHVLIEQYTTKENVFHDLSFLSEYLFKHDHPRKIVILYPERDLYKVIQSVGYYQKGRHYQLVMDPVRDQIPDSIFDEKGYIIDQGSMENVPFGWFTTREKGCGWIAAYNLLKMNGKPKQIQEVISALEKHNFLGKALGQDAFFLFFFLKENRLDVFLSLPGIKGCTDSIAHCQSGILLYQHSHGGHYAAFQKVNDQKVHFYNAFYRKKNHVVDLNQFLKAHTVFHSCLIIGCKSTFKW